MKAFFILLGLVVLFLAFLFKRNSDISPVYTSRDDILFKHFPSHSYRYLENKSKVPDYFHNYGADLLIIHGLSNLKQAAKSVKSPLHPVQFNGKVYTQIWIQNFRDTNIGPHKELLKVYVVSDSIEGAKNHGCTHFTCVAYLPMKAGYSLQFQQAWINEFMAEQYKSQFLRYDASFSSQFDFQIKDTTWNFQVKNANKKPLISGSLNLSSNPLYQMANLYAFLFRMDRFFNVLLMALHPPVYHPFSIITTASIDEKERPVLHAFGRLTPFFQKPSSKDTLDIGAELKLQQFQTLLYEYVTHFKFVTGAPVRTIKALEK